jgi:hypothetical protein
MPRVGLEPTIPAFERAKTVPALDRAATVIDTCQLCVPLINSMHIHLRTNRENIKKQDLWIEPAKKRKFLYTQLLTVPKYDRRQFAVRNEHLPIVWS